MPAFLYCCPVTGYNIQGFIPDAVLDSDIAADGSGDTYQTVTCTVCRRIHLVNPRTGKVAGAPQR